MLSEEELKRRRREQLREQRRRAARRKRQREQRKRILFIVGIVFFIVISIGWIRHLLETRATLANPTQKIVEKPPDYEVELLDINEYSRPGIALEKVNAIVIHYTANPGTTARQNRNYFNGLKDSKQTKVSAHFVIGLEGEIVQCIPCNEIAYASNDRNGDTISIECCHEDTTGKFNQNTKDTLVHLTAWLLGRYGLTTENIIRHYDVTGKQCPLYYVEHEEEWTDFKKEVDRYIARYGKEAEKEAD
ncbi:MAG: N-acetylmuramoyl-L-alanine amidase [Lachnospiraceae bacterium]|jgi:N-acetylmuramoyl-L-alanine amidase|nr:N-acetylmuramoyl-L-alanine amidase [Lachnospiraceae bacterium]